MIDEIIKKQRDFQLLVGVPLDDKDQMNTLAEVYLFKAIEEIIELRKEFPSGLNKESKTMKEVQDVRLYEELSDVLLFLVNFMIVRGMSIDKLKSTITRVQTNNFKHVRKAHIQKDL